MGPLKLSIQAFCQGDPGLMKTVPVSWKRHQSATAVGDELGAVVEADVGRGAALGGQGLEATDDPVGIDRAFDVGGQGLAGELVDDVQNSSILPSLVWSNWKSMAQTTLGRIGQNAPTGTPMPRSGFLRLR